MGSSRQKTYKIFFSILSLFIVVYGFTKILPMIRGPEILVEGINNGENHGPIAFISGKTTGTKELRLNDNELMLDEQGNFSDTLLLSPGYNVLSLIAKDGFGREKKQKFEITASGFDFEEIKKVEEKKIQTEEDEEPLAVDVLDNQNEIPEETGTELST